MVFGVRAVVAPATRLELWLVTHAARREACADEPSVALTFGSANVRMPNVSGGNIEKAIPDPIPNSEVKLLGADGTARATVWESRTLPG